MAKAPAVKQDAAPSPEVKIQHMSAEEMRKTLEDQRQAAESAQKKEILTNASYKVAVLASTWKNNQQQIDAKIKTLLAKKPGLFGGSNEKVIAQLRDQLFEIGSQAKRIGALQTSLAKIDSTSPTFEADIRVAMLNAHMDEFAVGSKPAKGVLAKGKLEKNELTKSLEDIMGLPSKDLNETVKNVFLKNAAELENGSKQPQGHDEYETVCYRFTNRDEESRFVMEHLFNRILDVLISPTSAKNAEMFDNYMKIAANSGNGRLALQGFIVANLDAKAGSELVRAIQQPSGANYNALASNHELKADVQRYLSGAPRTDMKMEDMVKPDLHADDTKDKYTPGMYDI